MPGDTVDTADMGSPPTRGRVFRQLRRVHLADASPAGRLRLDALARFLQDVSNEDTRDSGFPEVMGWVVRRTVVDMDRDALFGENLELTTWCSGTGPSWAERRVALVGDGGGRIETATLWVHIDTETGRPRHLSDAFFATFGGAAGGRTVRSRLRLGSPPAAPAVDRKSLPLRFADFDVLGHMNNAVAWVAVEEELATRRDLRAPLHAVVEFRHELGRDAEVTVHTEHRHDGVRLWLQGPAGAHVVADVRTRAASRDRA